MRDAAADLDFETAARLRDEVKRLKAAELATMDDPLAREESRSMEKARKPEGTTLFAKPSLDDMGPGTDATKPLFRKNDLDEMTVGRTEKPVRGALPEKHADDPRPLVRGKAGIGSYEDPVDEKRKGRTKGKTGRPGR
jgi:excinuclease ABC subunit B